jgi:hypothetical protein
MDLYAVTAEMAKLRGLYDIYATLSERIGKWAGMLWAELEIATLNDGIAELANRLKDLSETVKAMPTCIKVDEKVLICY